MITAIVFMSLTCAATDPWLARVGPAMNEAERSAYKQLTVEAERHHFQRAFWNGKALSEAEYMERVLHADRVYGSGTAGSGANTDQGRMYIASGPPSSVQRLPSSRTFVASEVWHYDSLPGTGYRSRLQFLFFCKAMGGDFRLYWPGLHSIRDLLIPQPGTRGMFPANDVVTANDLRERLRYSPAEEEIVDAATGVARGITGSGNGEILGRATSIVAMVHGGEGARPEVTSRFAVAAAARVEVRSLHFWVEGVPVTDIQVRGQAKSKIGFKVETADRRVAVEQSMIPLGFDVARPVFYTQRFFLTPGQYVIGIDIDGTTTSQVIRVSDTQELAGEALEEQPGDYKIALLPDPRSPEARVQASGKNRNALVRGVLRN